MELLPWFSSSVYLLQLLPWFSSSVYLLQLYWTIYYKELHRFFPHPNYNNLLFLISFQDLASLNHREVISFHQTDFLPHQHARQDRHVQVRCHPTPPETQLVAFRPYQNLGRIQSLPYPQTSHLKMAKE